jgi:hypothetical protein
MGIIYKSLRTYKVVGSGPGKVYPRITLSRELAYLIGKNFLAEVDEDGTITLRPERKNNK